MKDKGIIVEKIDLGNGLELCLLDHSRILAGDRWLVSVEARIEVPLSEVYLDGVKDAEHILSILKKEYGEKVDYSYIQEKHFVDQKEKDSIFQQFIKNIKDNLLNYLSHPKLAQKILLARYRELKRKAPWLFQ